MTIIINSFNHIADNISLNESLKEEADEIFHGFIRYNRVFLAPQIARMMTSRNHRLLLGMAVWAARHGSFSCVYSGQDCSRVKFRGF